MLKDALITALEDFKKNFNSKIIDTIAKSLDAISPLQIREKVTLIIKEYYCRITCAEDADTTLIINELFEELDLFLQEYGYPFSETFDRYYWESVNAFLKANWDLIPNGKAPKDTERSFLEMFDSFHNSTVKRYPQTFVIKLKDIKFMYRCRTWDVDGGYDLMIPLDRFAQNNRWNHNGIAYLYMACSDDETDYDGTIKMVEKTCFEEIRLEDNKEVSICQFKSLHDDAKILNLCHTDTSMSDIITDLHTRPEGLKNEVVEKIQKDKALQRKMQIIKDTVSKERWQEIFELDINKKMKEVGVQKIIENTIYEKVSLGWLAQIEKAIFHPVDKTDDPKLKAYIPFRLFADYLIDKGYDGIMYRSTRMMKIGLSGTNIVLFNKKHATYIDSTMKKYLYRSGQYTLLC